MKELVSKLFNTAVAEKVHVCGHVTLMAFYCVDPALYPEDKFTHEDWLHVLDKTEAPEGTTCVVCCHECHSHLPSRLAETARKDKEHKEEEQRGLKVKRGRLKEAIAKGLLFYACDQCESLFEEEELISVRFCPHCNVPFSGEEGRNCPDCNRPFSRLLTDKGCPDCYDGYEEGDECVSTDLEQELRRLDDGNQE